MNKASETGLQDLLFNGAIACLLLFIIYAIKANGAAVISSLSNNGDLDKFQATASMPLDTEAIEGEMVSYRRVHIKDLENAQVDQMLAGSGWVWDSDSDTEESIEVIGSDVILGVSFINHPKNLKLKLSLQSAPRNITVYVIEGHQIMGGRSDISNGKCSLDLGGQNISNLKITFQIIEKIQSSNGCDERVVKLN